MLTVTENAKKLMKRILLAKVDNYYACLRITSPVKGELGLGIDVEQPGDHIVEYEGTKLLVIEPELAVNLGGITLDITETPEGPELVIGGAVSAGEAR